ncbi:MAG: signal peptide peptidase SppA [Candidatus Diapherotrites archaeon]|uniref:Signal peptide peptidase SppA n=1 Tax=Candidatus Iainarchaeum sp. TaxID=3101447 RepID=A0A8T3YNB9_9ARCH|nr:signal peptide peptidase SppA [Candidatus Diapherotrites archaeon]
MAEQKSLDGQLSKRRGGNGRILLVAAAGFVVFIAVALLFIFAAGKLFDGSFADGKYVPSGIAVIPLKGEISSSGSADTLSANEVIRLIDDAEANSGVGAILLDIDSPGGEVVASKQIVYRVRESKKPVYSYINSMGASGAYYVAASTRHIMADEDSLTGSIGVISEVVNIEGFMEKIGVKVTTLKEGSLKDTGSPFTEFTPEHRELLEGIILQAYQNFKYNVLEFRAGKITSKELDAVADGRILTGSQAYEHHLIDEITTRKRAIDRAGELAGIRNPEIISYEEEKFSLYSVLFSSGKAFGAGIVSSLRAEDSQFRLK